MKWSNGYRIRLVLVGFAAAVALGVGNAKADFTFGEPTNLGPTVNSSYGETGPSPSADGLALYFRSNRSGGYGSRDIWVATRQTVNDPWGQAVNLGPTVNTEHVETNPDISSDGLTLYFCSDRPGGIGLRDLWVTTRASVSDPWGEPVNLGPVVNSTYRDISPDISSDGLTLYFDSDRPGGLGLRDLWVTTRATIDDPWGEPVNLGPSINSSTYDVRPGISADGLWLFFDSTRPGGHGQGDLWVTTRASVSDPWGPPVNLGPIVNSSAYEEHPNISSDGSTIFFDSDRSGGFGGADTWQVSITPIVDFNGDGIVDSADICIMVDHWGEDYPLCDIGPTPWGDGFVDVEDLIVLAEHLFQEVKDPTLIAHWALDEEEGTIAYDSAGTCDGTLVGDPVWRPTGGMVNGALQIDGVDDCVITSFILDPADGPFSVFTWVRGGAPGQAVLSQIGGANWLLADASDGKLMTELVPPAGRLVTQPLVSEFVVTDGNWHRIGFVWDGSHRTLYVDDVAVAEDTQTNLEGSYNGLYIGADKAMEAGTYWSGLIDDVRIYNRAVKP